MIQYPADSEPHIQWNHIDGSKAMILFGKNSWNVMIEQIITNALIGVFVAVLLAALFLKEQNLSEMYENVFQLKIELENLLKEIEDRTEQNGK